MKAIEKLKDMIGKIEEEYYLPKDLYFVKLQIGKNITIVPIVFNEEGTRFKDLIYGDVFNSCDGSSARQKIGRQIKDEYKYGDYESGKYAITQLDVYTISLLENDIRANNDRCIELKGKWVEGSQEHHDMKNKLKSFDMSLDTPKSCDEIVKFCDFASKTLTKCYKFCEKETEKTINKKPKVIIKNDIVEKSRKF